MAPPNNHTDHSGHNHAPHDHSAHDHAGHDHAGHDHDHTPQVTSKNERKILISFFMIFSFMIVEAVGGIVSGSLALLADAAALNGLLRHLDRHLRAQGIVPEEAIVILDGNHDYITPAGGGGLRVQPIVKADRDCASAAAASVLAKVARDDLMTRLHDEHPVYRWERNKGYASAEHRDAIRSHGLSAHHRASWAIADAPTLF